MSDAIGCGDNSCIFRVLRSGGVGTNGGCRCFKNLEHYDAEVGRWNREEVRKVGRDAGILARELRLAQKRIAELEAEVARLMAKVRAGA